MARARKPRLLPESRHGHWWLYLLERSNGEIKVGRTSRPQWRFFEHRAQSKAQGKPLVRFHLLGAQSNLSARAKERAAVALLAQAGQQISAEEFLGITFPSALALVRAAQA